MKIIADLHIHSYYSRATSKSLNLEHLNKWAQIKGLKIVATGDITHPKWFEEMQQKLEPGDNGLFRLRQEFARETQVDVPGACQDDVYFILSGEISSIYKKNDKVRKIHNVVFFPSFESVAKFQTTLDRIGNIHSDGRPILGLDSRDLLEIVLDTDPQGQLIPAHIWTPWFSLLGSKSGFDSVEECFEDLTPHIFALETGLSSDPPMNWRLSALDKYTLVSNSDAHSPEKLAREANIFHTDLSYEALFAALKDQQSQNFWGTIEFFPEEGKYHMDGHRKCGKMMRPTETIAQNGVCPVCGKPATLGVSYRVEELADRPEGTKPPQAKPFLSLIPLPEVLSEVYGVGPKSKRVQKEYFTMLHNIGSELKILVDVSISDIRVSAGPLVAEAIRRMREGEVHPIPGYDGEYGIIRIFDEHEKKKILQQGTLFSLGEIPVELPQEEKQDIAQTTEMKQDEVKEEPVVREVAENDYGLNEEQRRAVEHRGAPLIVQAGPGTGKTRTLVYRLASLIKSDDARPEEIVAVTFTNKAAEEMRQRLEKLVGLRDSQSMAIQTFHAFGANFLRETDEFYGRNRGFRIIDARNDEELHLYFKEKGIKISTAQLDQISYLKGQFYDPETLPKEIRENVSESFLEIFQAYEKALIHLNVVDYDDLIILPVKILRKNTERRSAFLKRYRVVAVDEFQDINRAQYELFLILALTARDVCVIGDPDQAIYGFRGASREFFLRFTQDFPQAKFIRLQRNYRSAENILKASTQLLGQSSQSQGGRLWSKLAPEVKVRLHQSPTDRAEAEYVVHQIEQLMGGTSYFSIDSQRVDDRGLPEDYTFSDFAILVRTKQIAAPLIEALSRSGIPFDTFETIPLTSEKLTQIILQLLRFRTTNGAEGYVSKATLEFFMPQHAEHFSDREKITLSELKAYSYQETESEKFIAFLEKLETFPADASAAELLDFIFQYPQVKAFLQKGDFQSYRQRMISLAQPFDHRIHAFADALALQKDVDTLDERGDRVRLMTLHASKGLEFPVVFIVGCEDNILPYNLRGMPSDVDEERRLLYVGMTRAQRLLYLSHAKTRMLWGQRHQQTPSRFLAAIAENLLQRDKSGPHKTKEAKQLSLF